MQVSIKYFIVQSSNIFSLLNTLNQMSYCICHERADLDTQLKKNT